MSIKKIQVRESLFKKNDEIACENGRILHEKQICSINFMGSPGSGKTAIIENIIQILQDRNFRCGVIEGDIAGTFDSERIEKLGVPVVQINTDGACLDAYMIKKGIENLPLDRLDIVIVENVGNLVCPAEFKLGVDYNVIVASTPEGEEKAAKYPLMYSVSDLVLLNKIDMLGVASFDCGKFKKFVRSVNKSCEIIFVSAKTGENIDLVADYIIQWAKK